MEELKNLIERSILYLNCFDTTSDDYLEKKYTSRFDEATVVDSSGIVHHMLFTIWYKKHEPLLIHKRTFSNEITEEQKIIFFKEVLHQLVWGGILYAKKCRDGIEIRDNNTES